MIIVLHKDLSRIGAQLINFKMKSKNFCVFWNTLVVLYKEGTFNFNEFPVKVKDSTLVSGLCRKGKHFIILNGIPVNINKIPVTIMVNGRCMKVVSQR